MRQSRKGYEVGAHIVEWSIPSLEPMFHAPAWAWEWDAPLSLEAHSVPEVPEPEQKPEPDEGKP